MIQVPLNYDKDVDRVYTDKDTYYLILTKDIDYISFFIGTGKSTDGYNEIIVYTQDSFELRTSLERGDGVILDSKQFFYEDDLLFQLTKDEVLNHILMDII